ncbi:hypothetical protein AYR62_02980 [Secundilactobacillus paracollinoides]|uniref:beta-1,6-N-acetylglucosaminyltransferase n=1 Tax=Secundilactobacillus paracollinoides TaxID=240427 RepID=UPI00081A6F8D|nr:beta-1,6-N-acetylglucosaminyltransferase [Secundilactobacillus paracollinoides]ANZ63160.1 hypothetical protein AYR62_02980 [Secundilactobacillus paracollinoides]
MIQAEINLLKIATKTKHSIYHLISGLDLPIAGQDEIHNFFDSHIGENFLTYSATIPKNKLKMRIKKYNFTKHFRDYNIFLRIYRQLEKVELGLIQKDKLPIDLIGYGSNWCSISHELAREIVCSENLIFKIFNKGFLVDELFIPTLINIRGKSKFPIYYEKPVHNISDEFQGNLRYINWWDGSPKTWRISDFDEIKLAKQSGHFFSRKFDEKIDNEIIKKVIHELVI